LGKILGEAIFLLEVSSAAQRRVDLPHDFGEPSHRTFFLPANFHIIGTMNSADRSIALVDVAVRRRFAFVSLWPRMSVIEEHGCGLMKQALEWDDVTLIVDAKYKRHFEELQSFPWSQREGELRDQHRHDLQQVLAYANLARTSRVIACLAYPCRNENWQSLKDRGRVIHQAELSIGSRAVGLWLTALPMSAEVEDVSIPLVERVRELLVS
jgi:hypothetical protein